MAIDATILRAMQDAGASIDVIIAAIEADAAIDELKLAEKRAKDAERQRQHRANKSATSQDVTVTERDNADVTESCPLSLPPKELISNPPTHTPVYKPHGREAFPKPDWAESGIWRDFLKNRKAKKLTNTETAYRRFLGDIEKHSTADWPPGRLLEHAVGKGWGAIYKPEETKNDTGNRNGTNNKSGSGDGLFDAAAKQLAAASAGRDGMGSLPDYSGT